MNILIAGSHEQVQLVDALSQVLRERGHTVFHSTEGSSLSLSLECTAASPSADYLVLILNAARPSFHEHIVPSRIATRTLLVGSPSLYGHNLAEGAAVPYVELTDDIIADSQAIANRLDELGWVATTVTPDVQSADALLDAAVRDPAVLESLDAARLSSLLRELFQNRGYSVQPTQTTRDTALDFAIESEAVGLVLLQVMKVTGLVSIEAVRSLASAVDAIGARACMLITTSSYTAAARSLANKESVALSTLSDVLEARSARDFFRLLHLRDVAPYIDVGDHRQRVHGLGGAFDKETQMEAPTHRTRVPVYALLESPDRISVYLERFKAEVLSAKNEGRYDDGGQATLPSVCLLGLGRCGSNIAVGVSAMVFEAAEKLKAVRAEGMSDAPTSTAPSGEAAASNVLVLARNAFEWVAERVPGLKKDRQLFLVEPIVIVGDLDRDIHARVDHATPYRVKLKQEYKKLMVLNLLDVQTGGAGNVPILGQYLARIVLTRDIENSTPEPLRWAHSYLIDSVGLRNNQSRLFFFVFSAGGGTGSGMATEFATAQQFAFETRLRAPAGVDSATEPADAVAQTAPSEPIFSCGIAILPHGTTDSDTRFQAIHSNAGRLLCKYLAEERRASVFRRESGERPPLRPFNALLLISNDIMQYASIGDSAAQVDTAKMEKLANQYVAQQIFNILTAQAPTTDYNPEYFRSAGIDIGDTIRLDANDLFMSLAGPVAVAYAEAPAPSQRGAVTLAADMHDMLFRSMDMPTYNKATGAIEGISILPEKGTQYREHLRSLKESLADGAHVQAGGADLNIFKRCSATTTIISLPTEARLPFTVLGAIKTGLDRLFPNTRLKRYALVIGASRHLALTTLIAGSPVVCDEPFSLITGYIKRCFGTSEFQVESFIEDAIADYVMNMSADRKVLERMLASKENPAEVIVSNWPRICETYEELFRHFVPRASFVPMEQILVTRDDVFDALDYVRNAFRHRQPAVQPKSLARQSPKGMMD